MDLSDSATQQEELMRELALRRAANHAPDLPATGECHWCGSLVAEGHRFCDRYCRDMFDKAQRINRIAGKRA